MFAINLSSPGSSEEAALQRDFDAKKELFELGLRQTRVIAHGERRFGIALIYAIEKRAEVLAEHRSHAHVATVLDGLQNDYERGRLLH